MKSKLNILIACFAFLVATPVGHAEDLETFLKRTGTGDATKNDLHENFHGIVFLESKLFEMDRDKLVKFWEQQKAAGTKLVVDKLTVVSKTETPNKDDKGAIISVVAKVSVTENVGGSTLKIQSVSHFIVVRDPDGTFHLLYYVVPKQVRKA